MNINSSNQSDVKYTGKVKSQIFEQYHQELLIKAKVTLASKLAERAALKEVIEDYVSEIFVIGIITLCI